MRARVSELSFLVAVAGIRRSCSILLKPVFLHTTVGEGQTERRRRREKETKDQEEEKKKERGVYTYICVCPHARIQSHVVRAHTHINSLFSPYACTHVS